MGRIDEAFFSFFSTFFRYRPAREEKGVKYPYLAVYMVLTKAGSVKIGDPVCQIK